MRKSLLITPLLVMLWGLSILVAMAALTPDNVGDLDQGFLTDVLLYHVARGRRYSTVILASKRIRTLERGFLFQAGGTLTDNLGGVANIIVTDVEAANGVIHAIDAVVLPYAPPP